MTQTQNATACFNLADEWGDDSMGWSKTNWTSNKDDLNRLRKYHKQITAILVTKPELRFHTNKMGLQLIQEIRTIWQSTERLKIVESEIKNYREKIMLPLR